MRFSDRLAEVGSRIEDTLDGLLSSEVLAQEIIRPQRLLDAMTKAGAQQNLAKLAARDLVASEDRISGRGRPQRYWALTDKGHSRFPDRHSDLTLDLLKSTEAVFGEDGLDRLIRHREETTLRAYSEEMAGLKTLKKKIEALVAIRSREGYMAESEEAPDGSFLLMENHCPVCAAAAFCQGLCRSELEIFRAVLGPGVQVERTDHILAGARRCAYAIRPGACFSERIPSR